MWHGGPVRPCPVGRVGYPFDVGGVWRDRATTADMMMGNDLGVAKAEEVGVDVFVDDVRVADLPVAIGTLADVLRFVQEQRCPPDRVVVGLRCDGIDVMGDTMTEALDRAADAVSRLEIATGTQQDLVADAMLQASQALDETERELRHIAQRLTEGKLVEVATDLVDCVKVWQQIHTAIAHSLAMMKVDADTFRVDDQSLTDALAEPAKLLTQVKQALTAQDYVMLADLFEYEFTEVATRWHAILDAIADRARTGGPDDDGGAAT